MAVAGLTFIYALCVLLAAPGLGALSDRYGRRPILILCLLGSAAGYLIFGIGGALWYFFRTHHRWLTAEHQHHLVILQISLQGAAQQILRVGWRSFWIGFIIGPISWTAG